LWGRKKKPRPREWIIQSNPPGKARKHLKRPSEETATRENGVLGEERIREEALVIRQGRRERTDPLQTCCKEGRTKTCLIRCEEGLNYADGFALFLRTNPQGQRFLRSPSKHREGEPTLTPERKGRARKGKRTERL